MDGQDVTCHVSCLQKRAEQEVLFLPYGILDVPSESNRCHLLQTSLRWGLLEQ